MREVRELNKGHFVIGEAIFTGLGDTARIWQRAPEFRTAARNLWGASHALDVAARSGDLGRIRAAVPSVGGSRRACHQSFRAKD